MSTTVRSRLVPVVLPLAVLVAALPRSAAAQAPPPSAEEIAVQRYGEGRRLLEAGSYEDALVELRAAYEALPSPNTELLIGHAQRLGGQRADAAATYRHVIETAGERVRGGEERYQATLEEAGRWAATLRASLGEVEIAVVGAPEGTVVEIDGSTVETVRTPRGLVVKSMREPGPVSVTAKAPDGRTARAEGESRPGAALQLELQLAAAAVTPPPPIQAEGGVDLPPLPVWIAGGVGVAGLATFGIFGAMSASAASDLDACAPRCGESLRETADDGQAQQTIANVGLVVGAVGLVAAGVLWFTWPDDEPEGATGAASARAVRVRVSPSGVADATWSF